MTDSIAVLSVSDRITDSSGVPVNGGSIEFYVSDVPGSPSLGVALPVFGQADLTVPLGSVVYTDSAGYPVTAQYGTTKTGVFTGTGYYKVIIKDGSGNTLITRDNIPGALNTSSFTGGGGVQQAVPVVAKSSSYTVLEADNGTLFDVNCSGANAPMTLPSAITVGNDFYVGFRHNGTANAVIPTTVSSQTIRHSANVGALSLPTKVALTGKGETIWLASDGANWVAYSYVPALINNTTGVIAIADRLSAPPSHVAGARYILTASPSGAWSTFAENDIAESDGSAWFKRTPVADCGWIAYVQDEDINYQFVGSAWQAMITKAATQAVQETGTSLVDVVVPGTQKFHPSACKAFAVADVSGNLLAGFNIASVTDGGTGVATFNFTNAMSSANYSVVAGLETASTGVRVNLNTYSKGTSSFALRGTNPVDGSASEANVTGWHIQVFGDQ